MQRCQEVLAAFAAGAMETLAATVAAHSAMKAIVREADMMVSCVEAVVFATACVWSTRRMLLAQTLAENQPVVLSAGSKSEPVQR
jgi:hypothetical protein